MTDNSESEPESGEHDHLEDLPDGCGCAEVWEHLSGSRADAGDESP